MMEVPQIAVDVLMDYHQNHVCKGKRRCRDETTSGENRQQGCSNYLLGTRRVEDSAKGMGSRIESGGRSLRSQRFAFETELFGAEGLGKDTHRVPSPIHWLNKAVRIPNPELAWLYDKGKLLS
ncbi:hypothetical protein VUR80DRAFT_7699 [Thermomyces stellatus]